MRKKLNRLSLWCFVLALAIFVVTYMLFHYLNPDGSFSAAFHEDACKPFVTLLFGIWGVSFLSAGVLSLLIARIFCPKNDK